MRRRIGAILLSVVLSVSMVTPAFAAEPQVDKVTVHEEEMSESASEPMTIATESTEDESQNEGDETSSETVVLEEMSVEEVDTNSTEEDVLIEDIKTLDFMKDTSGSVSGGMSNDEMFEGYVNNLFGLDEGLQLEGTILGDKLTGSKKRLYDYLKVELAKVANGENGNPTYNISFSDLTDKTIWSPEELGYSSFSDSNINKAINEAIGEEIDVDRVTNALLEDYPYELYWFDKTVGWSYRVEGVSYNARQMILTAATMQLSFCVSSDYSLSGERGTFVVDTSKTSKPKIAAANAKRVVTQYANLDDVDKLFAYKDYICNQVEYDHASLSNGANYGDPWQMINVFDEDPSTNVVCEGYSKAFQ